MSGYFKYRPAVPLYVYVIIVAVIVALIVVVLGMAGYIDLTVVSDTLIAWVMAPVWWATVGIAQTLILYVGGALIVFFVAFLIAKRRYLVGQKATAAIASPTYPPRGADLTASPTPEPTPPPTPKEENKT